MKLEFIPRPNAGIRSEISVPSTLVPGLYPCSGNFFQWQSSKQISGVSNMDILLVEEHYWWAGWMDGCDESRIIKRGWTTKPWQHGADWLHKLKKFQNISECILWMVSSDNLDELVFCQRANTSHKKQNLFFIFHFFVQHIINDYGAWEWDWERKNDEWSCNENETFHAFLAVALNQHCLHSEKQ